jgi:hypothetical protein
MSVAAAGLQAVWISQLANSSDYRIILSGRTWFNFVLRLTSKKGIP